LLLVGWPPAFADETRDESEVVLVGTTDPDMVAAIGQARATLDEFLAIAANPHAASQDNDRGDQTQLPM